MHGGSELTQVLIYTDGYFPDQRKKESEVQRIGGVVFPKDRSYALTFSTEVPQEIMDFWIPRKTQIVMIEAIALPVTAETFKEVIRDRRVVWLVDSDPVLGAGIKGYSAREDICFGIAAFWQILREVNASVYLDRIPTDGNLADGPSRAKWDLCGSCNWACVGARIPRAIRLGM